MLVPFLFCSPCIWLRSLCHLRVHLQSMQIWFMCMVFVTAMQFLSQLKTSDFLRTIEYQPEECLRHCEIRVHFPPFALQPSARFISVNEEESIVQMIERSPRASTRNVPQTRVWRTLHAEGMYPYDVQRMQHLESGDLAQRLEFCSWPNGNLRHVVTSCLLTYRNSVATVSVIQLSCVFG